MVGKLNVTYNHPFIRQKLNALENGPFPVNKLVSILSPANGIRYGVSTPPPILESSEKTVPFVRATDIKNGEILVEKLLHININQSKRMEKCLLEVGEMILVRSGVNTGDCAIVSDSLAGSYGAYDLILHFTNEVIPLFVSTFLDTELGRIQLNVLKDRSAQSHLNAEEVSSILIPKPPIEIQRSLVAEIEVVRQARRQKLAQADELFASTDTYLLEQLGLSAPEESDQQTFAVRLKEVKKRFDSHFYHPNFRNVLQTIQQATNISLGRLVQFSSETWDATSFEEEKFIYLEISSISLLTGEVDPTETPVNEAPSRARMVVRNGDIIVSTTRPHHGAIAMIDDELDQCIASTGFAVIRRIIDDRITRTYLWCILRSQLCLRQMRQRSSGGNYPAITEEELRQVLIPIPSIEIQEEIATEVQERRSNAQQLRQEAESEWEAAKTRFERQLLGKLDP